MIAAYWTLVVSEVHAEDEAFACADWAELEATIARCKRLAQALGTLPLIDFAIVPRTFSPDGRRTLPPPGASHPTPFDVAAE